MEGFPRIERVVSEFKVWLDASLFPVPYMKVKIRLFEGEYMAVTNLHRRHRLTGFPEYMCGIGSTAEQSLNDLLTGFIAEVREHCPARGYVEADFEWSDPLDF